VSDSTEPTPDAGRSLRRRGRTLYQLEGRHTGMLLARFVALPLLALAAVVVPLDDVTGRDRWLGVLTCAGAVAVCALLALVPRRSPRILLLAANAVLVVDGAVVAALALLSGGHDSPALWLLPLTVLAATLGFSIANGVKAAVLAAIVVGTVHLVDGGTEGTLDDHVPLAALTLAVLVVGAAMSRVNEREIAHQRAVAVASDRASVALGEAEGREAILAACLSGARALMPGWTVAIDTEREAGAERLWREDGHVHMEIPLVARAPRTDTDASPSVTDDRFGVMTLRRPASAGAMQVRRSRVSALENVVRTAAVTLSRDALLTQLARLSASDPLTGLANRRAFDADLTAEVARARRSGVPVGLALVDVDHFKRFNDTHGHQAGDEALIAVARALRESARVEDRVCRIGGEEFALILPGAGTEAAVEVGERVRRAIEAIVIPYGRVTASIGITTGDGSDDEEALIAAADANLYRAKDGGRNRVVADAPAAA
jgi:diguanylate cyclase (GGDEF)-like protein